MRSIWYGDRRDRVKWGGLFYLAERFRASTIVQIAMLRDLVEPVVEEDEKPIPIPREVWQHFSDLRRIMEIGVALGHPVHVIDRQFDPRKRSAYFEYVVGEFAFLSPLRIVFLDPDIGIGRSSAGPEHVRVDELSRIWRALDRGDVLAVYQHAGRTTDWVTARSQLLQAACYDAQVQTIQGRKVAGDVALLWCRK
jgi:hypothetical protein